MYVWASLVSASLVKPSYRCRMNKHSYRCRLWFESSDPAPLISKLTRICPAAANKNECLFIRLLARTCAMSVNIDIRGRGVRPTLKTSRMSVYLSDTGMNDGLSIIMLLPQRRFSTREESALENEWAAETSQKSPDVYLMTRCMFGRRPRQLDVSFQMYTCTCIYTYIYIYICIYTHNMCMCIHIYIYIYIYNPKPLVAKGRSGLIWHGVVISLYISLYISLLLSHITRYITVYITVI